MILKLVFNKQIHVYDIKSCRSLSLLQTKIKQMFKNLPLSFVIYTKTDTGLECIIQNDQNFVQVIERMEIQGSKILKMFIREREDIDEVVKETESKQLNYGDFEHLEQSISSQIEDVSTRFLIIDNDEQIFPQELVPDLILQQKMTKLQIQNSQNINTQLIEPICVDFFKNQKIQQAAKKEQEVKILFTESEIIQIVQSKTLVKKEQQVFYQIKQKVPFELMNLQVQSKQIEKTQICQQRKPKIQRSPMQVPESKIFYLKCDICNKSPILGVLYKCIVCRDYDLCHMCQATFSHQHALLKIQHSHQIPLSMHLTFSQPEPQPQYKQISDEQPIDISHLQIQQKNQYFQNMASQIAQTLQVEYSQCLRFIRAHQSYSKERVIDVFIKGKIQYEEARGFEGQRMVRPCILNKVGNHPIVHGVKNGINHVWGKIRSFAQ